MKRQRLHESEMDIKMDSAIKSFKSLSEQEKIKWKTAIKQCIEELGYSRMIKTDELTLGWMAALAAAGLVFSIPFLIGMAVLPAVFVGVIDKDKIIRVIKCARNKRKGDIPSQPSSQDSTQIQESKMKKTIRLTESELVDLVQRIIKEDEMMSSDMTTSNKTVQNIINTGRFNKLQEGVMVTIKSNKVTIEPGGSETSEKYVIDLGSIKHSDVEMQQTKVIVAGGKLVIRFISGEKLILEPSMRVIVFQP